jgi:hypothetical protein
MVQGYALHKFLVRYLEKAEREGMQCAWITICNTCTYVAGLGELVSLPLLGLLDGEGSL